MVDFTQRPYLLTEGLCRMQSSFKTPPQQEQNLKVKSAVYAAANSITPMCRMLSQRLMHDLALCNCYICYIKAAASSMAEVQHAHLRMASKMICKSRWEGSCCRCRAFTNLLENVSRRLRLLMSDVAGSNLQASSVFQCGH